MSQVAAPPRDVKPSANTAAQGEQLEAPASGAKKPGEHSVQLPSRARLNWPAVHASQAMARPREYLPASQLLQVVAADPAPFVCWPASHSRQSSRSAWGAYLPYVQSAHAAPPTEYCPASQSSQNVRSLDEIFPMGQSAHSA